MSSARPTLGLGFYHRNALETRGVSNKSTKVACADRGIGVSIAGSHDEILGPARVTS